MAWVSPHERRYVAHVVETLGGWLTEREGAFLYALAARGPGSGAVVEIGSNRGKSTTLLACAACTAGRERVHAIDPHRGGTEAEFRANLAREGVDDWVIPHVARSQNFVKAWRDPVRLLFVDGLHTYEGVRADYTDWVPFVVEGGVIPLHDTFQRDGLRRVVEETILGARDSFLDRRQHHRRSEAASGRIRACLAARGVALRPHALSLEPAQRHPGGSPKAEQAPAVRALVAAMH
ncbi:MAG TPA: class I SAM-dependent methyltransferase [Candidatus Limnocylindria bacterium]|nr:class I SAM-dependent methyltransferase [Candidatus Limnocylindria bacterium]